MDDAIRDWVIAHRNGALTEVMINASRFGSTPSLIVIALAVAALLAWRGRRGDCLLVIGAAAGVFVLGPVLKVFFERPRPPVAQRLVTIDSWSFPSGHSLNSMVVLGLVTLLAVRARTGWPYRTLVVALGAFLVFLVGFSRVYLGVHWPSDVLAGWAVGVLWLAICLTLRRRFPGNSRSSGTVPSGS
ncbi:phosphatase PAP2 family protein [Actinophytocola sp.]|uniref:phosphatase PAP2 family protein n=1 Tax=Actinophytocola sp. TaxID=1872138 RepID=UPI00389A11AA